MDNLRTALGVILTATSRAYSVRCWDRITLLLYYVINPARRLTTNNRSSAWLRRRGRLSRQLFISG
jgi:hypothetical protein